MFESTAKNAYCNENSVSNLNSQKLAHLQTAEETHICQQQPQPQPQPQHITNELQILNECEWRKYTQLKHRRLAAQPFAMITVPQENTIDIERIISGEEKRVTVMIRNIPNKVTHNELKEFIDVTSWGDYEFLYLRIDFENRCNVGYAFVSFADPRKIVQFFKFRSGKKWSEFKSEKVCQLAFAKVQGMGPLIQKFQKSKVLESNPEYRPRIYHIRGEQRGEELEFPL